jgi:DnaD/phage-associated family protein
MAHTLVDKEITEPAALEEELRILEALRSFEGEVRTMFGMKTRALTTKESKMLRSWQTFGYDVEIVRMAYEKTVAATNEPSVPYTNAILERWNAEGLRTAEEIRSYLEEQEAKKNGNGNSGLGNSFDTDDFFEAALRRSYQEN